MSPTQGTTSQLSPPPVWADLLEMAALAATVDPATGKVSFTGSSFKPDDSWAIWFQQLFQRASLSNGTLVHSKIISG